MTTMTETTVATQEVTGVTRLTVTHELDGAPAGRPRVPNTGGGWAYVLSDLKTLVETGHALAA